MRSGALRSRARQAIADSKTAAAVTAAADRFDAQRAEEVARVPDFEGLRRAAANARSRSIADLAGLLGRLADRVEAAGGTVWWAGDADEANRCIVEVCRRRGARSVVKAKSMVTEEIGLNRALQDAGMRVVETDLGEWIVQLAGDPPSHIIVPAIHLDRDDVADLFRRHGAGEIGNDPAELAAYARRTLRSEFLTADVGISGCNLAVAETGTVCIVTNEGNGRLVTSVPPVHVAVMGMERVVADWEELDLMMSLLPRSATGQDLSVYVNFVTGARRAGEVDGPEEFHLVVVDNGRSDVLGGDHRGILSCIRCGACLSVCPVYRRIGGHGYGSPYSGPVGAVISSRLGIAGTCDLPLASSLCGACYEVCPVMIPLQDLLLGLRRDAAPASALPERLAWRWWSRLWASPFWYRLSVKAAACAVRILPHRLVPRWGRGRDLPRPGRGRTVR